MRLRLGAGLRGALRIGAGTAAGQVVVLGVSPLLSRLYPPETFGILTVVASSAAVLAAVSTLRYEAAVPLVRTDDEAVYVMAAALRALTGFCLGVVLLIVLCRGLLDDVFDMAGLFPWFWLVPVLAWVIGAYEVLSHTAVRMSKYGAIAQRSFTQHVVASCAQLILAITSIKMGGLVVGQLIGRFAAVLTLCWSTRALTGKALSYSEGRLVDRVFKPHWRYPVILAPSTLLNILGTQAPFILIAIMYGSPAVGFLGFAYRIVSAPIALVGQALSQVFVGQSANALRGGNFYMRHRLLRVSAVLLLLASLLVAFLVLLGPNFFSWLFGDQWRRAGELCRILAVAFGLQLLAVPVSQTLIMKGRQITQLIWDGCRLLAVFGAILVPFLLGASLERAVFSYSVVAATAYAVLWLLCLRASNAPTRL